MPKVNNTDAAAQAASTEVKQPQLSRCGRFRANHPTMVQTLKCMAIAAAVMVTVAGLAALGLGLIPGGDKAITWLTSGNYAGMNHWQLISVVVATTTAVGVAVALLRAVILDRRQSSAKDVTARAVADANSRGWNENPMYEPNSSRAASSAPSASTASAAPATEKSDNVEAKKPGVRQRFQAWRQQSSYRRKHGIKGGRA